MNWNRTVQALDALMTAGVPGILWGPPGVGKSATVRALARARGREVVTLIGSTIDPTDIGGIPVPREGGRGVYLALPPWAEPIAEANQVGKRDPVLFADELVESPPSVAAALYELILNGRVAGRILRMYRVAASNPEEISATQTPLPPAMANRLVHLEFEVDHGRVVQGFREGFDVGIEEALAPEPRPEVLEAKTREVMALLAVFLERNPGVLMSFPKDPVLQGRAWPSPRSWEMAARGVAAALAMGYGQEVAALIAQGAVGGAGLEFVHFLREMDLPAPEEVLSSPRALPERDDRAHATLMSVVRYALEDLEARWEAVWRVLRYAAEEREQGDLAAKAAGVLIQGFNRALEEKRVRALPLSREILGPRLIEIGAKARLARA